MIKMIVNAINYLVAQLQKHDRCISIHSIIIMKSFYFSHPIVVIIVKLQILQFLAEYFEMAMMKQTVA